MIEQKSLVYEHRFFTKYDFIENVCVRDWIPNHQIKKGLDKLSEDGWEVISFSTQAYNNAEILNPSVLCRRIKQNDTKKV